MTQEDKYLLLKDLCGRIPYAPIVKTKSYKGTFNGRLITVSTKMLHTTDTKCTLGEVWIDETDEALWLDCGLFKPYLRPMSSMTEEEREEYLSIKMQETERVALAEVYRPEAISEIMDWLNAHHFDYRGLIEKGLAIEVTEENNPYKE